MNPMIRGIVLAFLVAATPLFAEAKEKHNDPNEATFGSCLAAVSIAEAHDNEWQASFSIDDCRVIFGKAIDAGYVLMDPKASDETLHRALEDIK